MKKKFSSFTAGLFAVLWLCIFVPGRSQALALPWDKDRQDRLNSVQFLNYLDFAAAESIAACDSLILSWHYGTMSAQLDLSAVKDERIIEIIEALGEITDDAESERLSAEAGKIFSRRLRDSIYRSLSPQVSMAQAIWKETASLGTLWYDYRKNRPLYNESMRGKITLAGGQIKRLREIRQELLRASWELSQRQGFAQSDIIGQGDMDSFVSIIAASDPEIMSRQLSRLLKDQEAFRSFPPFWFYSALSQLEKPGSDRTRALAFLDRYESSCRDIFKKDPMTAMEAMIRLSLTSRESQGLRTASIETMKSNCGRSDWQYYLMSAVAESETGLYSKAQEDVLRNMDNGDQVSLSARVLAMALLEKDDPERFQEAMAEIIEDRRVKAGDVLAYMPFCRTDECRAWLDREISKITLTVAGSKSKSIRLQIPESFIDYPCSLDISVTWSKDVPGWESSISPTALAVLPKPGGISENRLIETESLSWDPGLPPELDAVISHPLYSLKTKWELTVPEEGAGREFLMGLSKAFPFYRPEAGNYKLKEYKVAVFQDNRPNFQLSDFDKR